MVDSLADIELEVTVVSGSTGPVGPRGFSGYSGSGISGYSGYSGFSGDNPGSSGYSGYSGSGISGYSGMSGYSGISGYSGYIGESGYSGISGYSGSGISGYSGINGTIGSDGASGYSGYSGIPGPIAGTDKQVTFNDNGVAAGDSGLTFDKVTKALKATNYILDDISTSVKLSTDVSGSLVIGRKDDPTPYLALGDIYGVSRGLFLGSNSIIAFQESTPTASNSPQTSLRRKGLGNPAWGRASDTPLSFTHNLAADARPGVDTNIGGANATITSGVGTGTGTVSSVIISTPTLGASGTAAQVLNTRAKFDATGTFLNWDSAYGKGVLETTNANNGTVNIKADTIHGQTLTIIARDPTNGSPSINSNGSALSLYNGATYLGTGPGVFYATFSPTGSDFGWAVASPTAYTHKLAPSSRAGVDTNVGGANAKLTPGVGTGTGTPSAVVVSVPVLGASGTAAQTLTDMLTVDSGGIRLGSNSTQFYKPFDESSGQTYGFGLWRAGGNIISFNTGGNVMASLGTWGNGHLQFNMVGNNPLLSETDSVVLCGKTAYTPQWGVNSATPIAYTHKLAPNSRAGTDTNVSGANATITPGIGTGSSTGSSVIISTPSPTTSGTGAQTATERARFDEKGITATGLNVSALNSAPASATDTGTTGEVRYTADYIYVCVATNTWKRTQLLTW